MDKLQGGDWNSFFHQFEAVASQSTTNVSRPSIVDDNVPLPIIRGHHFDIVYHDAMDEHVKCQVCGMLLRRTMFAAHVRQRHPEHCPPSISTDDDSGRHSGLESPDISRNPSFPFSPKLMSPPITKEPIKLTISLKGHRKHRRKKAKRERRRESRPSTSAGEERCSPAEALQLVEDRFWPREDEPGPSAQYSSPNFLEETTPLSNRLKGSEISDGAEFTSRISPEMRADAEKHSPEEQWRRKVRKKSRRKSRRRDLEAEHPSSILSVPPRVEPLHLDLSPDNNRLSEIASPSRDSSRDSSNLVIGRDIRPRPETRGYLHAQETTSAFTSVPHGFSSPLPSPSTARLTRFSSQSANVEPVPSVDEPDKTTLVGQPSQRAEAAPNLFLPQAPQIPTAFAQSPWIHSQSEIPQGFAASPAYNIRLAQGTVVEGDTFRSEAVPFDPVVKPAFKALNTLSFATTDSVLEEQQSLSHPSTDGTKLLITQRKSRQPSGSQELWEPLGIKSPTYGIILPVATKTDNDADDATVAFLTSSPELLSEDDSCPVKEEVDEQQGNMRVEGMSPSRLVHHRLRPSKKLTSESSDTDQRTIIDLEEDQAERRSSDRDGDIQKLSNQLAALSQLSGHELDSGMNSELETTGNTVEEDIDNEKTDEGVLPFPSENLENVNKLTDPLFVAESQPLSEERNYIPVLVSSQEAIAKSGHSLMYNQTELAGEVIADSAVEASTLENVTSAEPSIEDASQRYLESRIAAAPLEDVGGQPISVIISSRTDMNNELEAVLETSGVHHHGIAVGSDAGLELRKGEEENLYDEDYSADDDELIHFHEESERNHQEMLNQLQQDQMPVQQQPLSTSSKAVVPNQSLSEQTVIYRPGDEHAFPAWSSQAMAATNLESPQLSVQTVFENSQQITTYHSDPTLQTALADVAAGPVACHFENLFVSQSSLCRQPTQPHTFPLERCQTQRTRPLQQKLRKTSYCGKSDGTSMTSVEVEAQEELNVSTPLATTPQQLQQRHQFKYGSELLEGSKRPLEIAPLSQQQNFGSYRKSSEQISGSGRFAAAQSRHPAELMEEEMRAMRYVYLMNEQRIAKKALAQKDRNETKFPAPNDDITYFSELPPITVEPTVIPEGIPRSRMQKHLLPPYHHAQFNSRGGLCVSPCKSDASEDELVDVQEVMNLENLEPMGARAVIQRLQNHSEQATVRVEECRDASYVEPRIPAPGLLRQQRLSGDSQGSEQFSRSSLQNDVLPSNAEKDYTTVTKPSSKIPHSSSPIKAGISQQQHMPESSKEVRLSSNEEESCVSNDEGWASEKGEGAALPSDDESTDSELVRRGWDLSPSVSPLTLENLTSVLSSPEGSDSNDDQIGVPVWSTMSRKHAKLAIAVCRNMPKRLQPLCRRFVWQQGITYLLENFCLQKWEIRPEHDVESVWFFDKLVRRFKPFDVVPWEVNDNDDVAEMPEHVQNVFFGFNICADIPYSRSRKTIRIEDHASLSLTCKEARSDLELSSSDASSVDECVDNVFMGPSGNEASSLTSSIYTDESTSTEGEDVSSSDEKEHDLEVNGTDVRYKIFPQKLSCEKQEFIAMSCCKQFLQQMVTRKSGNNFRVGNLSAVQVTTLLSELYREHRAAYELMIADIIPIPVPDQREIPFSDNAEWVASRILAINRAQNRLLIPTFPPWAAMHRLWKVYGPLHQFASAIGGDFEKFVGECVSVAYNHYYRIKNGIKVADEIPGDLLDLCYAITSERMREHTESVEAVKKRLGGKTKFSKTRIPLRRRKGFCSFGSQQSANELLLSRCRRVYDEKRQLKRRRWNTMRYLHNALPGCVIEGIDVFDMAQRTNLSVAGIFGPEHKLGLTEMPFASDLDNRPAYMDMEELLALMDRTLALQSGSTVDQEGNKQPTIDFLTVHGLHFKATTGERGRCNMMVSPAPIPVPPVTIDCYGNVTAIKRAAVPKLLYPEFANRKLCVDGKVYPCSLDSSREDVHDPETNCSTCLRTSEDYADMDFARMCFKGLPWEMQDFEVPDVDTSCTSYQSSISPEMITENDLTRLLTGD
uniref:C2H2-type domain-containing protein n=1 Tax=Haemonchus contortus TaxID=6289 RepID=A0A7I4YNU7_HAECO